ncbi:MAG: glycosyltransferase family 2 protein [Acidobacteria bacterium]|nr:glycosyltransferase family 2 protein [Acidobacteriota bacterium]
MLEISFVVPIYNEAQNLRLLYRKIIDSVSRLNKTFELIFVDDGSDDESYSILEDLAGRDSRVMVVRLARNFGQTAALAAGFELSKGEVLIPMDGDLQNDPADIGAILRKLDEGYDVVSCWRKDRQDQFLTRRLPSVLANKLVSWISGVYLHDYGCTLKGYRRELMRHVRLYGEMHRFIPIFASWAGARVTEIVVRHHPRQFGQSNYGIMRSFKVILDLVTIKFLGDYSTKPMYFFGGAGILLILAGFATGIATLVQKFYYEVKAHRNPLLLGSIFFAILGVQFVLIGLIAELITRTYHESQGKPTYIIKTVLNSNQAIDAQVVRMNAVEIQESRRR